MYLSCNQLFQSFLHIMNSLSINAYRFGRHQDREDGALSGQVSQKQTTQLNRQQGGL